MPRFGTRGQQVGYSYYPHRRADAPVLILQHGFTASSVAWNRNLDDLRKQFSVLTIDLLGHGGSDSPEDPGLYTPERAVERIVALMDQLAIEKALFCGHSLGGALGLRLALDYPERLYGLVIINSNSAAAPAEWRAQVRPGMLNLAERVNAEGTSFLKKTRLYPGNGRRLDRKSRNDLVHAFDSLKPAGLANSARSLVVDVNCAERVGELTVPTLIIVGTRDAEFAASAPALIARLPASLVETVTLDDAGHAANIEKPREFLAALLAFTESLGPMPPHPAPVPQPVEPLLPGLAAATEPGDEAAAALEPLPETLSPVLPAMLEEQPASAGLTDGAGLAETDQPAVPSREYEVPPLRELAEADEMRPLPPEPVFEPAASAPPEPVPAFEAAAGEPEPAIAFEPPMPGSFAPQRAGSPPVPPPPPAASPAEQEHPRRRGLVLLMATGLIAAGVAMFAVAIILIRNTGNGGGSPVAAEASVPRGTPTATRSPAATPTATSAAVIIPPTATSTAPRQPTPSATATPVRTPSQTATPAPTRTAVPPTATPTSPPPTATPTAAPPTPTPTPSQPYAAISGPSTAAIGQSVTFVDASQPQIDILTTHWSWSGTPVVDGSALSAVTLSYSTPGCYSVDMTVFFKSASQGLSTSTTVAVGGATCP